MIKIAFLGLGLLLIFSIFIFVNERDFLQHSKFIYGVAHNYRDVSGFRSPSPRYRVDISVNIGGKEYIVYGPIIREHPKNISKDKKYGVLYDIRDYRFARAQEKPISYFEFHSTPMFFLILSLFSLSLGICRRQ